MPAMFRIGLLFALILVMPRLALAERQVVGVGAYNFPPYVMHAESTQPSGLLVDLIELINTEQDTYQFVLVPTSGARRYQDLDNGRFDMIAFESREWGWENTAHQAMPLNISDAEVYVARQVPGRDQGYFDQLSGKRLALYTGYHYGFADFNTNRDYLRQHYKAMFSYSHDSNLQQVLHDRADIAVVTRSFLDIFRRDNPQLANQLLVSEKTDQTYSHQLLVRAQSPIAIEELQRLQTRMVKGKWPELLGRYQLKLSTPAR